jgi:septal ring factor EnvC (AmiA/AmiB activator)
MSEIIERNRTFLVKSKYGSFTFNNKQSAKQLNTILTDYENTQDQLTYAMEQSHEIEQKFDNITKNIIQLQMTVTILQNDLDNLKMELSI